MAKLLALLAVSATAFTVPSTRHALRLRTPLRAADDAEDLLAQAAALRAEAGTLQSEVSAAAAVADPVAAKANEDGANKMKIKAALRAATESGAGPASLRRAARDGNSPDARVGDKAMLQASLGAAEAAGFSGEDEVVAAAVAAFNAGVKPKQGISDEMKKRLTKEAQSGDPTQLDYDGGLKTYGAIFAIMAVLVVLGGKDILY